MKYCTKCRINRPKSDFYKNRSKTDGLAAYCKFCSRLYHREWSKKNADKIQASARKSRAKPEIRAQRAEYNKKWKKENPDKVTAQNKRSYTKHAEERRLAARERYATDPKAAKEQTRRWREQNREKVAEYRKDNRHKDREYYAKNSESIRERREENRQWRVYRIDFPDETFYIGSSCQHVLRFNKHKSLANKGEHVDALNGKDFDNAALSVVVLCENEDEAISREITVISQALEQHKNTCLNTRPPGKRSSSYWVYVMQSTVSRTGKAGRVLPGLYYVGMTTDPARRLREHNGLYASGKLGNPKGAKSTRNGRPWQARALYGPYKNRSEALKAEYKLKRQKRGINRTKWASTDSELCKGEGVNHPWVSDPTGWKPPKLE